MASRFANSIVQENSSPITKRRPLLFLATYFIGVIIATAVITVAYINRPAARPDVSFFLERLIGITLFLPMGGVIALESLLNLIGIHVELIHSEGPFPGPSNALGRLLGLLDYLLILSVPLAGSLAKRQNTFRTLYLIFIGLLFINIAGCSIA